MFLFSTTFSSKKKKKKDFSSITNQKEFIFFVGLEFVTHFFFFLVCKKTNKQTKFFFAPLTHYTVYNPTNLIYPTQCDICNNGSIISFGPPLLIQFGQIYFMLKLKILYIFSSRFFFFFISKMNLIQLLYKMN